LKKVYSCSMPNRLSWAAYFSATGDGSHQVRVRSLATDQEQPCEWTRRFAWSHGPFWCPDGESLLVHALDRRTRVVGLWVVNLTNGEARRIDTPGLQSASHGTLDEAENWLVFDSRNESQ